MKCPFCGAEDSKVVDSRSAEEGASIRRRRECEQCGRRFTTYERVEEIPLMVVKKDGRREAFSRNKILNGILKALEKRPVSVEVVQEAVDDIERDLRNRMDLEVNSSDIGELVMDKLRVLDEVAYVRFASVYRQFKDIDSFADELENLRDRRDPQRRKPLTISE